MSIRVVISRVMKIVNKQLSTKMLVIYMISALLFLTSIDLHIHTQEAATVADHGSAVSISSLTANTVMESLSDEITVSPDGVLKIKQHAVTFLAVLLFLAIVTVVQRCTRIARLRESNSQIPYIPFQGTPPLRAPPH